MEFAGNLQARPASMSAIQNTTATNLTSDKSAQARSLLAADTIVYLVLAALVWLTWKISRLGLFEAGDDLGYWLGVIGGSMMLILFSYPLRKHFRFAQNWGRVKWWFLVHMVLGIGGPLLILLHSTFRIGSLNAGVALYSMVIVALSGVVGRFIYARVHRGLRGEQTGFKELQTRAKFDQDEVRSRLAFAPQVEADLKAFEQDELQAAPGWLTYFRQVFWLPIKQWIIYRRCVRDLHPQIRKLAQHGKWSHQDLVRREAMSRKLIRRYLTAVVRVSQYTAYERLFSLWHVAHIPFVYLLIISAVVHVIAVHAY
jgi:hypothetical protein